MFKLHVRSFLGHPAIWVNPAHVMLIENYSADYARIHFSYAFNFGFRSSVIVCRDELYQEFFSAISSFWFGKLENK